MRGCRGSIFWNRIKLTTEYTEDSFCHSDHTIVKKEDSLDERSELTERSAVKNLGYIHFMYSRSFLPTVVWMTIREKKKLRGAKNNKS